MGSRTTWKIVTNNSGAVTWLYSHSGGDSKFEDTRSALIAAMPRWNDTTYGARIFISSIIGERWSSEYGFGLTATLSDAECPFEESYFYAEVDFTTQSITLGNERWSFDSFITAEDCSERLMEEAYA